jgi:hypothetical protein
VTPAQSAALRRAESADGPIAVVTSTARVLGEQYGYIEREGDGWVLTASGRAHLERERADDRRRAAEKQLTWEDRKWARRVVDWLKVHERFPEADWQYAAYSYAEHFAACTHAGVDPCPPEKWDEGARGWVEREVTSAIECLRDYDEAARKAAERGVGVTVSYEADAKVPRSREEATRAATDEGASVVRLGTYRERRPGPR